MTSVVEKREKSGWSWPSDMSGPPTRAGRIAGVVMSGMFMLYLTDPITHVLETPQSAGVRIVVIATTLIYGVLYAVTTFRRPWFSPPMRVASVVAMSGCGITLAAFLGPDDLVFMTFAISVALVQLPPMIGFLLGVTTTAALLIGTTIADGSPNWNAIAVLVMLTVALFGTRRVIASNMELRAARDEIATLAVAEERARMARDLHDVLGHSLTTITVKAGLARRILESSGDDQQAIAELRDVEQLSRTALGEVRSTVSGYRKASLAAELVGARVALQAAEIAADLPHAVDNVPAELQEPFAYVLREGVTNVIRHSNATRCAVRLGESWIEVRDDGTPNGTCSSNGHGLGGLKERLAKVGGSLSAGPANEGGFVVRASVAVTA